MDHAGSITGDRVMDELADSFRGFWHPERDRPMTGDEAEMAAAAFRQAVAQCQPFYEAHLPGDALKSGRRMNIKKQGIRAAFAAVGWPDPNPEMARFCTNAAVADQHPEAPGEA